MNRVGRRLTALVLLTVAFATQIPIPFSSPAPENGKDRSTPFPCQDRPCGCRTAEQCRKKCCCFSADQKLVWAKQNGLKASAVVDLAVKRESKVASRPKSCCANRHVARADVVTPPTKGKTKTVARDKVTKIVIGIIAQECQGNAQTLFGQSVFLIPPVISLESFIGPAGERFTLSELRFAQPTAEPPVPPPRLFAA